MNRALRIPERWRLAGRVLAAFGIASAITVTGLPGIETDTASAAPRAVSARIKAGAKRCDVKNLGTKYQSTPKNSGFPNDPTGSNFSAWQGNPKNFNYDLPGKAYDGVKPPTAADRTQALSKVPGDTEKNYKEWQKTADKSGDPEDRKFEIYARYFHNQEGLSFE
ncbi:hypothetical protein ACWGPC_59880, partial [Streptomyces mirabilis]